MEQEKSFLREREEIRRIHKELREAMPKADVREMSRNICRQMVNAPWYRECSVIYGYYPLGNEVDCREFLKQAMADGKKAALPRMYPAAGECRMDFYEITSLEQVQEGRFHVMEPVTACRKSEEPRGVVLVPGVVFDRNGNRYGYGKGYYDRYFSRFPELVRVALAYENQMEPELVVLGTDVKMDVIYTESGVYETGGADIE